MLKPRIPRNEKARQKSLDNFEILDTLPEKEFDDLTYLAAQICGTPIALISLVDNDRQWFKSKIGLEITETPRDSSFCAHAINTPTEVFEVKNAATNARFIDNPLVDGNPNIKFYAGASITTKSGNTLGTICVIDVKSNELTGKQKKALQILSDKVVQLLVNRKLALEEEKGSLKKRNNFLNSVLKGIPDGVVVVNSKGKFIHFNDNAKKMVGLLDSKTNPNEVRNHYKIYEADKETEVPMNKLPSSLALKGKEVKNVEYFVKPNNSDHGKFYLFDSTSLYDSTGEIFGALVVARDIDEKKRSEFELLKTTDLLSQAQNLAKIGHWELDLLQGSLIWSDEIKLIHEVGLDFIPNLEEGINFYDDASKPIITKVIEDAISKKNGWDVKLGIITAKGNHKWVRAIGKPYVIRNKVEKIIGVFQDITEEKLALDKLLQRENTVRQFNSNLEKQINERSAELKRTKQEFKDLYNNAPDIMLSVNMKKGIISQANKTAVNRLQYKKNELIGKSIMDIINSDSKVMAARILNKFKKSGKINNERLTLITNKGIAIPINLNSTSVKDRNGNIVESNSVLRDISKLVAAENSVLAINTELEQRVKQRTKQLQRTNDELEEFTYIATHDLKMPLANIKGHLEIIELENNNLSDFSKKSINWIKDSVKQSESKIQSIIDIARVGNSEEKKNELINVLDLIKEQKRKLPQNIESKIISFNIQSDEKVDIFSQKIYLETVISNLLENTVKYKKLNLDLSVKVVIKQNSETTSISIQDNGIGINLMKDSPKLFKMFSRLQTSGKGSGMGLYLSKKLINYLGGDITIESEMNVGSKFIIKVPNKN